MLRLRDHDPNYFSRALSSTEHWRIFPEFRDSVAYLDIETTGMGDWQDHITTISLYDGETIHYYVYGDNLDQFPDDIMKYKVVVTYNGKCFDIPFINRYFRITMDQAHIDLRYILHRLGYKGGLKGCEKQLGLSRDELDGVDGYTAVLLWRDFENNKNQRALETLLAYNILDAVNLETLMVTAYNLKLRETPFLESHQLTVPDLPCNPFEPDVRTLERIMAARGGW
ncbi:MAG: ribonuclease H-like domain-containing protein [Deltaproteobacteria bacterium]